MINYILNKIFYGFLTLFGVVTVVFLLFSVLPGDPARMMLDQKEDPEQLAQIRKNLGLDQPLWKQYAFYLNDLSPISFHNVDEKNETYTSLNSGKYNYTGLLKLGSNEVVIKTPYLRESFQKQGKSVSTIIGETLPNTMVLAIASIIIASIFGILLGIVSALMKDSWLDRLLLVVTSFGMSIPSFFAAIIIAYIFAFLWHDITGLNMIGSLYEVDDLGEGKHLVLKNLILPAITLGSRPLAVFTQLTRNSLLEVLNQDYIRTAFAKGLPRKTVITKHALRNALNPVITAISGWFASMLAGSVFVEFVFGWNGLGKEIVNALNTLDLPIVMGAVLVIAVMFILINILVDILYGILDPRVRIK
ncbi:peptide/nickel transport system permease protein [Chishuiella changwenlii]|uniref:Peptide ABC transporter permease n=1 Tax=Chishuiella changwenlii TaxID=1434701 RepID=A0A1M6WHD5_9FLAO|nr:ABC transporter permease [Chishuiella changwenlii]GGF04797.1 peptide ABC transporter permease [Chishuiella changwenlii]SHK93193.1 peptide/nickel transport system permease protein [Chishuiella changwenlii]